MGKGSEDVLLQVACRIVTIQATRKHYLAVFIRDLVLLRVLLPSSSLALKPRTRLTFSRSTSDF